MLKKSTVELLKIVVWLSILTITSQVYVIYLGPPLCYFTAFFTGALIGIPSIISFNKYLEFKEEEKRDGRE